MQIAYYELITGTKKLNKNQTVQACEATIASLKYKRWLHK